MTHTEVLRLRRSLRTALRVRIVILLGVLAIVGACARTGEAAEIPSWRYKVVVPAEGVQIMPEAMTTTVLAPCARRAANASVTRYRTVKRREIAELGDVLELEIARQLERRAPEYSQYDTALAAPPPTYYAQVVGFERDGKRLVYVNGFTSDASQQFGDSTLWHYQPLDTCDAGPDFFGAVYDPKTRTLDQFAFNGTK